MSRQKTFRHINTVPLPVGRTVEAYDVGSNRVPKPSPVLLVDRTTRTAYLVDPKYIDRVLTQQAARKPRRSQFKRLKNGA